MVQPRRIRESWGYARRGESSRYPMSFGMGMNRELGIGKRVAIAEMGYKTDSRSVNSSLEPQSAHERKESSSQQDLPPPPPREEQQDGTAISHDTSMVSTPEPTQKWLLPPIRQELRGRKCLVLDLDETLVHSSFKVRLSKSCFTCKQLTISLRFSIKQTSPYLWRSKANITTSMS